MAIRNIREEGDEILKKISKEVDVIDDKIRALIKDMVDTMHKYDGVGLAAVQVGILKRILVIDLYDEKPVIKLINPVIIKTKGSQEVEEGCLSFPEAYTDVKRYKNVMVKALNEHGKPFVMEAKDGTLLARAIQHENDHLDGILFIDHCINRFETESILQKHNLPSLDPNALVEEKELEEELAQND